METQTLQKVSKHTFKCLACWQKCDRTETCRLYFTHRNSQSVGPVTAAQTPPHYHLCLIDAVEDAVSTRRRRRMMITCHTFCLHSHTLVYRESLCKDLRQTPAEECLCVSHLLVFFSSLVSLRRFSLCSVLFSPSSVYTLSPRLALLRPPHSL